MFEFILPDIGEGVAEAEVVTWHVAEGDQVEADQPIVELMTDKATVEIPSPRAGRVRRLCCAEGDIVPVGYILIEIDEADTADTEDAILTPVPVTPSQSEQATKQDEPTTPPKPVSEIPPAKAESVTHDHNKTVPAPPASQPPQLPARPSLQSRNTDEREAVTKTIDAVPAVREFAKRRDVDLSRVTGTGPGGRIMRRDVEAYAAGDQAATTASVVMQLPGAEADEADWTRHPLRGLRRLIAERMALAKNVIPHFTYAEELDLTAFDRKRKSLAETSDDEISPLAFIAHAVIRALQNAPMMNATVDKSRQEIIRKKYIHLGIAAATDEGLLVPVIRHAEKLSVTELAHAIRDLATRAREKKLTPDELRGSTFTISSLGRLGGVFSTPIINYPEVAILGVNAIRTLPRYVDNTLAPRKMMNVCVSMDHRAVDGLETAQFVLAIKEILEAADFVELK